MATPNLANITTAYGNTAVQQVTTVATSILSNAAASNTLVKVRTLTLANKSNSTANVTVELYRSSTAYYISYGVSVPIQSAFVAIGSENQYYLLEGDSVRCTASANSAIDAIISFETVSNA